MTTLSGDLVNLTSLLPGSTLDVETKSRHYTIECLGGNQVRVSGHPEYCPNPVPALLQGSVSREGELELGLIGRGMRVVFFLNGNRPVTTSKVLQIRLERPPADAVLPVSSSSIH